MPSTKDASQPTQQLPLPDEVLLSPPSEGKLGDNVAKLESDLAREKEERQEERFLWISGAVVLLNFIGYALIKDIAAFIPLFLLQLILLVVLARRLGVDWAVQAIAWLMFQIRQKEPPANGKDQTVKPNSEPTPKPAPKKAAE